MFLEKEQVNHTYESFWDHLIISSNSNWSYAWNCYIAMISLITPYLYISIAAFRKEELFDG